MAGFSLLILSELLEVRGRKASKAIRGLGYALVAAALALLAYPAAVALIQAGPLAAEAAESGVSAAAGTLGQPAASARAVVFFTERPVLFYLFLSLALGSALMLLWTVFFELALGKKNRKAKEKDTVSWGSYGICRHPGFWWLALYVLSLGVIRGFVSTIFSSLLVLFFNFLLIAVQDRYSFPRLFNGYEAYRKTVPFLIPKFFINGLRRRLKKGSGGRKSAGQ